MKFIKLAKGLFDKFHIKKTTRVIYDIHQKFSSFFFIFFLWPSQFFQPQVNHKVGAKTGESGEKLKLSKTKK